MAELFALNISELLLVVLEGLKAAVTPLGKPVTPRFTLPVNPFWSRTVRALLPLVERGTVRLAGEVERLKLGETTVKVITVVPLRLPEVPLTVRG
jgi:hypothetical protein